MNAAALAVMKELPDLVLAYGNSDEYRYVHTLHVDIQVGLRQIALGGKIVDSTELQPNRDGGMTDHIEPS
jgi:hypothetical protein